MKIIKVTAMWCMSCLVMQKVWSDVFKSYNDIDVLAYDFDEDYEMIKKYNIGKVLPVLIVIDCDKEVLRIIDEKSKKELIKLLDGIKR
ncbi:MAG: thioredoxin family protein [Candidatus Izemoplasmatales bacterium]|nr:thioredoxin family protein [Candidatus Izemoplasmatales bacterium]